MLFKLEKLIFLVLIFSIPFQKRSFLFGPAAEGEGFFEWSSGFIYFTDILMIALVVLWFKSVYPKFNFGRRYKAGFGPVFLLLTFVGFAFISVTQAELIDVAVYRFVKIGAFIFLFLYVVSRARDVGMKKILWAFVASGVFQAVIAILQFVKQSSLGLHIFHESTLAIGMKGVAEIMPGGLEMIRAYGTFTNPNVLAGFLGICLFFAFYLFLQEAEGRLAKKQITPRQFCRREKHSTMSQKISMKNSCSLRGPNRPIPLWAQRAARVFSCKIGTGVSSLSGIFYGGVIFILSFGLLLTFSRGVIIFFLFTSVLFFAGVFVFRKLHQYKRRAFRLSLLFVICCVLLVVLMYPEVSSRFLESSVSEPAISERLFFNTVGVDTVSKNYMPMFFGIGIGNFVNHYMGYLPNLAPYLYQPVHNIFILIASEIGIIGLGMFVLFLSLLVGQAIRMLLFIKLTRPGLVQGSNYFLIYSLLFIIFYLLLISMYDHYFWTLQQGSLMFWVTLGLLASIKPK